MVLRTVLILNNLNRIKRIHISIFALRNRLLTEGIPPIVKFNNINQWDIEEQQIKI